MTQVSNEQKDSVLKTLAILGFVAAVVFGVWLAVQIVSLIPTAFTSLASIADGIYKIELRVSAPESTVNSGSSFTVSWNKMSLDGLYTFTYTCTDGVSVSILDNTGTNSLVDCDTPFTLGSKMDNTKVVINSERNRFTDVPYAIAFVKTGDLQPTSVSEQTITVVNASIPLSGLANQQNTPTNAITETNTPQEPTNDVIAAGNDIQAINTGLRAEDIATPQPISYRTVETVVLQTPTSDPNGTVDLAVRIIATGIVNKTGAFKTGTTIKTGDREAIQFEIRNIGTKTSDEWNFTASNNDGTIYTAQKQAELKPQEWVTYTLAYDGNIDNNKQTVRIEVSEANDQNLTNNRLSKTITVAAE